MASSMTPLQRNVAFAVCLATVVLAVLDMQIVSAATVPIVRDLDPVHGVDRIPWLISAYSLAATAALPLYGKLCDVLGTKRVFLAAVAVFLVGSGLCGAAQNMDSIIAFRAIQGIGGGGLMSVTLVVMAELMAAAGKQGSSGGNMGGLIAGAGMALGPVVGGTLADHANWRWIFYINLPLGIAVLIAGGYTLRLPRQTVARRIDFPGAALVAAFASALLLVTEWGGTDYAWSSTTILGLIGAAALLLALFLWRQATAPEPILPLSLFKHPVLGGSFAVQLLLGTALTGSIVYLLMYLQLARGIAATQASLYLIPMAIGMAVIGLASARLARRGWTARTFVVSGTATATIALALLATSGTGTSLWLVRGEMLLLGLGFGQLLGQLILLAQETAPSHQLGVATTSTRFFQTLGSALGTAFFGTVLARVYEAQVPGSTTSAIAHLEGTARTEAVRGFVTATHWVFLCAAGAMALALLLSALLPKQPDPARSESQQQPTGTVPAKSR
ncbi:MFS transporter [Streptomyces sp. AC512_CC834]|uniref:MFS transporter n=1 Tax=Streptomyces sp. AC512_CC834 TaxID=2823691 RepID=UPI001C270683|nr:MFS transporter [Streptomyces sp. AC512_CC834]